MSHGADSVKSILYALVANFTISIAKGVAAFFTGSGAMLAETIHSLADCGNQLLLLFGLKRAKRPPTTDYPLGYGKETYFWSFIVALMLFSVGGLFSLYEGWHKLHEPEALSMPYIALGVLVFAIVVESFSMWGCLQEVNKSRGDQGLWRWFRTSRQSELIVIFGEDLAALLGLVLAALAVTMTIITGDPIYDALGTLAIGALLVIVAILLGREIKSLLVGEGVEADLKQQMIMDFEADDGIDRVFNLVTLQMGDDVMVAVKAQMASNGSAEELIEAINRAEKAFKAKYPQVLWLFFEPDNRD